MRTITHTTKPVASESVEVELPPAPEKPILFSDAMVRAILSGRKTQTRRIIDPQPTIADQDVIFYSVDENWCATSRFEFNVNDPFGSASQKWKCRYGFRHSTLWVREAWSPDNAGLMPGVPIVYRADGVDYSKNQDEDHPYKFKWRPSIHMPRRFSRLTVRVKKIMIERLNLISEEDALAEGIERSTSKAFRDFPSQYYAPIDDATLWATPVQAFRELWDSINGADQVTRWSGNPWVWRIEFEKIENKTV